VYTEGPKGEPIYNFSYVDQVGTMACSPRRTTFVELSFMPRQLAPATYDQSFWYRPVVSASQGLWPWMR